jgi:hypothetical protein
MCVFFSESLASKVVRKESVLSPSVDSTFEGNYGFYL